jgi:hypothetical protein
MVSNSSSTSQPGGFAINRKGMDYDSFAVGSMQSCLNACSNDARCDAFTYVGVNSQPPYFNNQRPICWLKNGIPAASRATGMVSGAKRR